MLLCNLGNVGDISGHLKSQCGSTVRREVWCGCWELQEVNTSHFPCKDHQVDWKCEGKECWAHGLVRNLTASYWNQHCSLRMEVEVCSITEKHRDSLLMLSGPFHCSPQCILLEFKETLKHKDTANNTGSIRKLHGPCCWGSVQLGRLMRGSKSWLSVPLDAHLPVQSSWSLTLKNTAWLIKTWSNRLFINTFLEFTVSLFQYCAQLPRTWLLRVGLNINSNFIRRGIISFCKHRQTYIFWIVSAALLPGAWALILLL